MKETADQVVKALAPRDDQLQSYVYGPHPNNSHEKRPNWKLRVEYVQLHLLKTAGGGYYGVLDFQTASGSVDGRCWLQEKQRDGAWIDLYLQDDQGTDFGHRRECAIAWAPKAMGECGSCGVYHNQSEHVGAFTSAEIDRAASVRLVLSSDPATAC